MSLFDGMAAIASTTIAAVYADDAVFTPQVGVPSDIRIVMAFHNERLDFSGFETQARAPGHEGKIPRTLLATKPVRGDGLEVLTGVHVGSYVVRDSWEDLERSEWIVDLS